MRIIMMNMILTNNCMINKQIATQNFASLFVYIDAANALRERNSDRE